MTYTASIFFLGQYRPAHFEATTAAMAAGEAQAALRFTDRFDWALERLTEGVRRMRHTAGVCGTSSYSCEHGAFGVSLREGPHDPFLDRVCAQMPDYPRLDYSMSVSTRAKAAA